MNKYFFLLAALLISFNSAHAEVSLGSNYICDKSAILDSKGKTKTFAVFKKALDAKIASTSTKLKNAKKSKKEALKATLSGLKGTLKLGKQCGTGSLTPPISPIWEAISGTFSGDYDILLLPNTPFGSGNMKVENTFDGKTSGTTITFLTGVVATVFPLPTHFDLNADGAVFPVMSTAAGTPLGDLSITLKEDGTVNITTILTQGSFVGSKLDFSGTFNGNTFTGSFDLSYTGTAFAHGTFSLTRG